MSGSTSSAVPNSSTPFSYDELVYLCVSLAQAKEVYGLAEKSREVREMGVDWKAVRQGLIDKNYLLEDKLGSPDSLLVNPRLALMIEAVSWPKLFISISKPDGVQGKVRQHHFYFTRNFAVCMVKDEHSDEQYLLSGYSNSIAVNSALDEVIGWDRVKLAEAAPYSYAAEFTLDEYEAYLTAVRENSSHISMLRYTDGNGNEKQFPAETAREVYDVLTQKKLWLSLVILTFDTRATDSKRIVEQTVIYEGKNGLLWNAEITRDGVRLFCSGREQVRGKLGFVSSLFRYM